MLWGLTEKSTFFHCRDAHKPPPRLNGYWRVVQRQGSDGAYGDWDFVGFMPDYLERLLRAAGFDVEPTLRLWHQRGWMLARSKNTSHTRPASAANDRAFPERAYWLESLRDLSRQSF